MSWLFGGCCGSYRRRKKWASEQAERARSTSPFQPKTARFYGVQPLFPDPPARTHSPLTFDSSSDTTRSWTPDSNISRSQLVGGEKLERWLGENLRTIPEDDDRFELDGRELHRRTWFMPDDMTEASLVPSTSGKDSQLTDQYGGTKSDYSGEEEWDEERYAGFMSTRKYTPTFLLDETCCGSERGVGSILTTTSRARESTDCSTIATRSTGGASWVVQPLCAAPRPQAPAPKAYEFEIYEDISDERPGSLETNGASSVRSPGTSISEFGFERRSLRKKSSAGSFKFARLKSQGGYSNSWRRPSSSRSDHTQPELPGPTAQIPWRTISIRAVRRQFQELPTPEHTRRGILDELRGTLPPPTPTKTELQTTTPICKCEQPQRQQQQPAHVTATADAARIHNWVSGQQQYLSAKDDPTLSSPPSSSSSSPSQPLSSLSSSTRPVPQAPVLPHSTSRYPITETSGTGRTMTLRSTSSVGAETVSTTLGYGAYTQHHLHDDHFHHHYNHHYNHHHHEACPYYTDDELSSAPVYQEVDPSPFA